MGEARDVIAERYGDEYTMPKGRVYKTKSKGAQEAHESIRPTSFERDPDSLADVLKPEELRLYRLIWQRALASQMAPKELETTSVELSAGRVRAPRELDADAVRRVLAGLHRGPRRRRGGRRGGGQGTPAGPGRGRASRRSATSPRPSTSPSRRRASPRPRSSRPSRSTASAGPRPTPRRSRRSSIASTCASRSGAFGRSRSPAS